jgi:hypothetical protein
MTDLKDGRTEDFDLLTDLIDEWLNNPLLDVENGKYAVSPHTAFDLFQKDFATTGIEEPRFEEYKRAK